MYLILILVDVAIKIVANKYVVPGETDKTQVCFNTGHD